LARSSLEVKTVYYQAETRLVAISRPKPLSPAMETCYKYPILKKLQTILTTIIRAMPHKIPDKALLKLLELLPK
jgi:hypothetical protein